MIDNFIEAYSHYLREYTKYYVIETAPNRFEITKDNEYIKEPCNPIKELFHLNTHEPPIYDVYLDGEKSKVVWENFIEPKVKKGEPVPCYAIIRGKDYDRK